MTTLFRSFTVNSVRQLKKVRLFKDFVFEHPDYIEFDSLNEIIITHHTKDHCYRVWCMNSYAPLFTVTDPRMQDLRTCKGHVALIARQCSTLYVTYVDIQSRKVRPYPEHTHQ